MANEWLERWREGRIGFHRDHPHPMLVKHWPGLGVRPGTKVLVPLCGKSLDMRWLAGQAHPVLGIELAPEAIGQFMAGGGGGPTAYGQAGFQVGRRGKGGLWGGDSFPFHFGQPARSAPSTTAPP